MSPYDRVKSYILNDYLESESFKEEILVAAEQYGVNRIDVVKSAYVGKCLCNKIDYISNGIGGNVDKNDLSIILKSMAEIIQEKFRLWCEQSENYRKIVINTYEKGVGTSGTPLSESYVPTNDTMLELLHSDCIVVGSKMF